MTKLLHFLLLVSVFSSLAQKETPSFREDQIYISIAYPYFSDAPNKLIQNKLSYNFSLGFIRDMPINKKRTLALGVGLGWDIATVFNNMQFAVQDNSITASSIQGAYQKNTLSMQTLAIPFEMRWRNANETNHAFWRIHTGLSLHIPLRFRANYTSIGGTQTNINLPYHNTLLRWNAHFGFNTWNISIAHDLQPWAISVTPNRSFDIRFTKIGLIFYIL